MLPTEVLFEITSKLRITRAEIDSTAKPFHAVQPSANQLALKNLSLANRTLRASAQPILFWHVNLGGDITRCLKRIHNLTQLLGRRTESTRWIRSLRLRWPDTMNRQSFGEVAQFVFRLTHLRIFETDSANIPRAMYNQLFNTPAPQGAAPAGLHEDGNLGGVDEAKLPLLQDIRGPMDLVMALVPGRPIEKIYAFGERNHKYDCSEDGLQSLASGNAAVKELTLQAVKWNTGAMDTILELFPNVQILKIQFIGAHEVRIHDFPEVACLDYPFDLGLVEESFGG